VNEGLSGFLSGALARSWGVPGVHIEEVERPTAGAHREIIIFTARYGAMRRRLVATLMPVHVQGNSVTSEAAILKLAAEHGVPVPEVHLAVEDPPGVGKSLTVSEFVDGESVPRRILRLAENYGIGPRIVGQIAEAMARLHGIDPGCAPEGLRTYAGSSPARGALAAVRKSVFALDVARPVLDLGLNWLERHLPADSSERAIVHTDLRNGNIIVDDQGLRAVLDWERALVPGDPMEDLAWMAVRMWRFGVDEAEIGGLADRSVLIEAYERAGGTFDPKRFAWWKMLCTLRWALGLAELAQPVLHSGSDDIVWAAGGRRISEVEWDLLMLMKSEFGAADSFGTRETSGLPA
jgi:aminoglycoside phosphotransferase (APT) family kinase protein